MATNATVQPPKTNKAETQAASIPLTSPECSVDLSLLTKAQLLDMAAGLGNKEAKSTMRKAELIELLNAARRL